MRTYKTISVYDTSCNYLGSLTVPIEHTLKDFKEQLNNKFPDWDSIIERS
jgi:hypothetical protein